MFESVAFAQAGGAGGPGFMEGLFPILLMFVIFYFLLIRPQQNRQKLHEQMIKNLKKGDNIITNGGIYGEITGMTEKFLTVEVAENVRIKILKSQILSLANEGRS